MARNSLHPRNRDLISNLPECNLTHILSCLPTKEAVRTSVLSKAWKHKWHSIYNISVFDTDHFSNDRSVHDNMARFVNFMEVLLANSLNFKRFRLWCSKKYDASCMSTWISTVFRSNVEIVYIYAPRWYAPNSIILSCSLQNYRSLRILELKVHCMLKVSVKTCFLNLTSLNFDGVKIRSDNRKANTLTFNFPVLETLVLRDCKWLNVRFVEFCAPALSSFTWWTDYDTEDYYSCTIKIIGARLANAEFKIFGSYLTEFLFVRSTVDYAALKNSGYDDESVGKAGLQIRKLLKEFSNLQELELSCSAVQAIAQTKSGVPLPKYYTLQRLAVDFKDDPGVAEALFELLHAAPFLKLLDIDLSSFFDFGGDFDYEEMESVPSCIVSHLEEVNLNCCNGEVPELDLAEFLLEKGAKLKKFTISRGKDCKMGKDELADKLSGLPKASASITIVVT